MRAADRAIQKAWTAYHSEPPGVSWDDMIAGHRACPRAAVIFDLDRLFIAARIVRSGWDDAKLLDPFQSDHTGDTIHVYVAAGKLGDLREFFPKFLREQIRYFTFQRRGYRVHRLPASSLITDH